MPIPTKSLREMLGEKLIEATAKLDVHGWPGEWMCVLSSAAMSAIAEYDPCFAKAAEAGEPTFTLRAQDATADNIVYLWAQGVHASAKGRVTHPKYLDALAIADAMRAWPNRKLPD